MDIAIIIIVAIIFLVVGFILGNIFPIFAEDEEADDRDESVGHDEPKSLLKPEVDHGMAEIVKIWRKDENKELVAEIEQIKLTKGNQLNSEQHAVLSILLVDLQDWVGLEKRMEDEKPSSRAATLRDLQDVEDPLDQINEGLSRYNPLGFLRKAVQADVVLPEDLLSMSDQIDEIVQELLEDSPLKERGIRLMEIEGRGMVFVVGLDMYEEVDDIPDKKIQELIKSAVVEWEKRNSE